ncbi:MAG: zinc-dependent alcohol dehydrogenase family protein [Candidatus Heimdallarchaeota archaeon]|nr:zinc-dependent alcohol dehydrogenase family protein [Candidatus Heimdallarchaeota archaeon]
MKALNVTMEGDPVVVINLVDIEIPVLGSDEVLTELIAAPINPSDIMQIQGFYPTKKSFPAILGNEGLSKIIQIGENVRNVKVGDNVLLPLGSSTWQDHLVVAAKKVFPLPEADILQLSMIGINPPTAYAMITEYVELDPGDWIVQNAANSAVGRYVIELCKIMGYKTINIVRREELISELSKLGADLVVVDGPNLVKEIREKIGKDKIRLGLDAVAGKATDKISQILSNKGVILTYGALSLENIQLNMAFMMKKDITLKTYWLSHWLQETPKEKITDTYQKLIAMIASGQLQVEVDSTYPLESFKDAFKRAMEEGRDGKVLLTGPSFN